MSKKTKAASKLARLIKKRSLRAANKAKHLSWRQVGENSKSYRFSKKSSKKRSKIKGLHTISFCGNVACKICFYHSNTGEIFQLRKQ